MSGAAQLRSFEDVYTAHRSAVYGYCLSRLRDPAEAEDATQDVFVRALAHGLDGVREMEPWLITMARNRCVDIIRRPSRRRTVPEEAAVLADRGDLSADRIVAAEAVVSELLARLTPAERNVAVRAVIEDKSHREVAAALGIGASTSRVLLSRACRRLRVYLQEHGELLGSWISGSCIAAWTRWRRAGAHRTSPGAERGVALALPLVIAGGLIIAGGPGGREWPYPPPGNVVATAAAPQDLRQAEASPDLAGPPRLDTGPSPSATDGPSFRPGTDPLAGLIPSPSQKDVTVVDLVASPGFASDHTLIDVGTVNGCSPPPCYAAFASTDGGRTWTYLPSRGLAAGQLILPPDGFAIGRFFAFGSAGLQVTTDSGSSFRTIAPRLPGFASSSGPDGPHEVVVSNVAGEGYGTSATPTLLYSLRAGQQAQGAALYLPERQDALQPASDGADLSGRVHVLSCSSQCSEVATLPWPGPTTLVRSPAYVYDRTVVAVPGLSDVAVSLDGGRTFALRRVQEDASIHDLAIVPTASGTRLVVLAATGTGISTMTSDDLGGTWRQVTPAGQARPFMPRLLRWLFGSRLIEAGDEGGPATSTTFRCSDDSGTTWGSC